MSSPLVARILEACLLSLLAFGCTTPARPIVDADRIGGARALDTTFRVKDRVAVPGPHGAEYVLPIGEYRPARIDERGLYYASAQGILERAGFAKRTVGGGIFVPSATATPWERAFVYVDRDDGRLAMIPIPAALLGHPDGPLRFAVKGEEQGP